MRRPHHRNVNKRRGPSVSLPPPVSIVAHMQTYRNTKFQFGRETWAGFAPITLSVLGHAGQVHRGDSVSRRTGVTAPEFLQQPFLRTRPKQVSESCISSPPIAFTTTFALCCRLYARMPARNRGHGRSLFAAIPSPTITKEARKQVRQTRLGRNPKRERRLQSPDTALTRLNAVDDVCEEHGHVFPYSHVRNDLPADNRSKSKHR